MDFKKTLKKNDLEKKQKNTGKIKEIIKMMHKKNPPKLGENFSLHNLF